MSSGPRRTRRLATLVLTAAAAVAIVATSSSGGGGATARAAANVTITARDFFWSPDAVTIQVGDTVTWTNEQGFHNVLLGDSRLNQPGFPSDPAWNPPP
jgi:plastocyanin